MRFAIAGVMRVSTTNAIHDLNPASYPTHDGYCHRIADGLVSWAIRGRFAAMGYQRIVVRKSLKSLALARREPPHRIAIADQAAARLGAGGVGPNCSRRVILSYARLALLDTDRDLPARVRVAAVMWHRAKGRGSAAESPLRNPSLRKLLAPAACRGHFHPRWRQIHRLEACGRRTSRIEVLTRPMVSQCSHLDCARGIPATEHQQPDLVPDCAVFASRVERRG